MKKLFLFAMLLFNVNSIKAQLLNKLKQKAQQVVEQIPSTTAPKSNTSNMPASNQEEQITNSNSTSPNKNNKPSWQPTSDCEKLFTLQKGETILYDENKLIAVNGKYSYTLITRGPDYQFYYYLDGQRKGPFNDNPLKELGVTVGQKEGGYYEDGDDDNADVKLGDVANDPITVKYTKTINGKINIVFNGKTFGPYDYVSKVCPSPDKKQFWALVTIGAEHAMMAQMGMGNTFLINESGTKLKVGDSKTLPMKLNVSENFKAALVTLMDSEKQNIKLATSSGKTQEANMMSMSRDAIIKVSDNGDIIMVPAQSPTQVLANGNEVASFSVPVKKASNLIITKDYKNTMYYSGGKLYKNGGIYELGTSAVFPKCIVLNGQDVLCYFKVHKREDGEKDVYLCRKTL